MPSASIEEAVQETQGVENSKSSMASNSNSASEAGDGAAPASASQADVIEQLDDEGEEEESPKSGENGDISAAEKQPLKPSDEKPGPSTGSVENVIGDEEEAISKDDLDSDDVTIRKKGWDIRCVIVGILILIIMVGGATAAILVHRFKGQYFAHVLPMIWLESPCVLNLICGPLYQAPIECMSRMDNFISKLSYTFRLIEVCLIVWTSIGWCTVAFVRSWLINMFSMNPLWEPH